MILLLSPADKPDTHVAMLGKVSRMACDDQWRRKVFTAVNSSDIVRTIQAWDGVS